MKALLIAILLILLIITAVMIVVYRECFYSPHPGQGDDYKVPGSVQYQVHKDKIKEMVDRMVSFPSKTVTTISRDGLRLSARLYEGRPEMPVVIGFHGYRSSPIKDYSGEGPHIISQGYNFILPDQRAHGKSEGHCISFGVLERYDTLAWIDFARARFGKDKPIILSGVSMGAATVLMAADLDLPENVKGIMADCGYSSPEEIIKKICADRKLPTKLVYPLLKLSAKIFGHFDLEESSAVESVKKTKLPILLVHGEADRFVPFYMSNEIYAANPSMIEKHDFPDAGHAISYLLDEERYKKISENFIASCIQ